MKQGAKNGSRDGAGVGRRRVLQGAAVAGISLAGSARLRPVFGQAQKVVRYWTTQSAPEQRASYDDMTQKCEAAHPGIKVVVEYVSDNDVRPKLAAAVAGGTAPQSVSNLGITAAAPMAAGGLLESMDDAVKMVGKEKFEK